VACLGAHHLHKKHPVEGAGGITDLVNSLHHGVERGVIAYRVVSAIYVIVYRAGHTHERDVILSIEHARSLE